MSNSLLLLVLALSFHVIRAQTVELEIPEKADRLKASRFYESGRALLDAGEAEAALEQFNQAIGWFAYDADYFLARAKALSSLGKYQEAYGSIQEAISQEPGQIDYESTAGTISFRLKNYETAVAHFSNALKPGPANKGSVDIASTYFNRGISQLMLGNNEQAENDFTQAIARNKEFVQAYHNRGIARNRLGKLIEACQDLMKAVDLGNESSFDYVKVDCN
jgi:tetratricopeptide (TPR) repeat protein